MKFSELCVIWYDGESEEENKKNRPSTKSLELSIF